MSPRSSTHGNFQQLANKLRLLKANVKQHVDNFESFKIIMQTDPSFSRTTKEKLDRQSEIFKELVAFINLPIMTQVRKYDEYKPRMDKLLEELAED